ncbi:ATP-binding protein [Nakamurella multipartita]|jgi:signal transduction histidine kinase|uniref:histidine kinase n=1 Tax=Nakamurella multipartita (strain ATCC 700099 / DSM 44233 / CIP 104796 / JCM 9543 / NBRC 105858 / Y-104) TaxID=479431 RepID=C8X6X0_NAKMY|nr:ATP-binding protein [Nakamurella multipartita]ACV80868.1 histidine kinase [Nakamurella multipartita DSM 44233]HOZ60345.1 ATP-binding protein [Nakamurella multipartita]
MSEQLIPTEPQRCSPDELRTLFLFEKLTDEQLDWLCTNGWVKLFEPGPVYAEGDPATCFYVLIEGTIALSRRVGPDDVETTRTSQPGVYAGAWRSYLGERAPETYNNTMRAVAPSRFFVLDAPLFAQAMREWFPMAVHMLEGLFYGIKSTNDAVNQRERLLALGSLSAGLTHELNNPASAAVRATAALRERVAGMRHKLAIISTGKYAINLEPLVALQEEAAALVAKAPTLSPIEVGDAEDEIGEWLDEREIPYAWDIAPTFVQAGIDVGWLEKVSATVPEGTLDGALKWLYYTVETELLMNEIHDATTRISTLVGAAKQYSQLDRAPFQTVDVHELLDSTLTMLSAKLAGLQVVKEYDRSVPAIPAYPAELNQVWTNLIDNARDAMGGQGTLTVRTSSDGECLTVEIGDTGPGIPPEIQGRIFEQFFTTKPVGEGTGLGLDISWRIVVNKHHGDLTVLSVPGDTRFRVRLPLTGPQDSATALAGAADEPTDS